jgi:hypothetical protein
MAFTIVGDWWTFLDGRTAGRLAQVFVLGETSGVHPRVDEAAKFATSAIYNALVTKYKKADVDAFAPADADAEMRLHAGALAMFALTSTGSARTADIANDYAEAQTWLTKVRSGTLPIESLVTAASSQPDTAPKGFVRFRPRERNFRRGSGTGGDFTDYDIRNPKL